jgi:hypothetical protein
MALDLGRLPTDCLQPTLKEKAYYLLNGGLSFVYLVAWGGIEPPTQGFSIHIK